MSNQQNRFSRRFALMGADQKRGSREFREGNANGMLD
jgi:hypothetical protein